MAISIVHKRPSISTLNHLGTCKRDVHQYSPDFESARTDEMQILAQSFTEVDTLRRNGHLPTRYYSTDDAA